MPDRTDPPKPVERLFPYALRARILLVGQTVLERSRSRLHFVLLAEDVSARTRDDILRDFAPYPVVQRFSSAQLGEFFNLGNCKVLGFAKSDLAKSVYRELRAWRLNPPSGSRLAGSQPAVDQASPHGSSPGSG